MPIPFKKPNLKKIQEFSIPENYENWIPGLFSSSYYNNLFPINPNGDYLEQDLEFKNNNIENFNVSMNRYLLFLNCLKSNPFLFEKVSSTIEYDKNSFLFTAELSEYLYNIQTNTEKNKINSSLTIELVKKYAVDTGLDLQPQKLSDFFDVVKTQDYIDKISRKLNSVTYESVIKHTLYNKLKENSSFSFKEESSAGWTERAASLAYGDSEYFIDTEGGPDNKSFPVVCVITKTFSKDSKQKTIDNSNKFLSNVFGRNVNESCLARIIGEVDRFENNFKQIPLLKGKKDNENYYNAVCVVYDFIKILLSKSIKREFIAQSIVECSLGFLTKYKIELSDINDLSKLANIFSSTLNKYFNDTSFEKHLFVYANIDKHSKEINSRINIENLEEIKTNVSQKFILSKQNLISSFESYVSRIISDYQSRREQNIYLSPYGNKDTKIFLHFDSFFNLLGITTIPSKKIITANGDYFTPFLFVRDDKKDQISFDLEETEDRKTLSDEFYSTYKEYPENTVPTKQKDLIDFTGHKIVYITRILEKQISDNYQGLEKRIVSDSLSSNSVVYLDNLNLKQKLKININKSNLFEEERFIDKTLEFISLSTNYRENKYQSSAIQTLNYYLHATPTIEKGLLSPIIAKAESIKKEIEALSSNKGNDKYLPSYNKKTESDLILEREETDLQTFASFHYPVLSLVPKTEDKFNFALDLPKIPEFEIPQDILIVSADVQKAFSLIKMIMAQPYELNLNLQHYALSSLSCYADLILLIKEFAKIKDWKEGFSLVFKMLDKLPLIEILMALLEDRLNKIIKLGQEQQACLPPPVKSNLNPEDLLKDLEYLKTLYYNVVQQILEIQGIVDEIPKLPTLDVWKAIILKIFYFILNIAAEWVLGWLAKKLKKYLDRFCTIDFDLFDLLNLEKDKELIGFNPALVADSFGALAGSGGALDTVDVNLDINTLIDLTKKATREFVYNKFADKYSINKNQEKLDEISAFFYQISNVVDAFELSTLLRGVQTETTTNNLIDFIKLSNFSFKDRFKDSESINDLFVFLSQYCDYKLCYDFLTNSMENYVGNICSLQNSKKDKIEGALKSLGGLGQDINSIIRDQVLDLQKDIDDICSTSIGINIDLFKDGPRLLASSLNKVLSIPFNTVIQFQDNILSFETGKDENGTPFDDDYKKTLKDVIFNPENFKNENYPKFRSDFSAIKSKYYNSVNITELYKYLEIGYDIKPGTNKAVDDSVLAVWNTLSVSTKDEIILQVFSKNGDKTNKDIIEAKNKIQTSIDKLGLQGYSANELQKMIYRRFVSYPLLISEALYKKAAFDDKLFIKGYTDFIYNVDYLNVLASEIEEDMKNATNVDLQDDEILFFSYIDKIKELQ